MALLHIYDSSDWRIRQTAWARGVVQRLPIADGNELAPALDALVTAGTKFDRILFETHGSPGNIYFGNGQIGTNYWRGCLNRRYSSLTEVNTKLYFNGCNVAEGDAGWDFLDAAAGVFLSLGGGRCFGQTSVGFGNPFNGHVVHLWGVTRYVFVDTNGRIQQHDEM